MADPFKVIGGTGDGDGAAVARTHRRSFNSLFAVLPTVPLIPGDYHLMPPLGRQFRKTVRCCSLAVRRRDWKTLARHEADLTEFPNLLRPPGV